MRGNLELRLLRTEQSNNLIALNELPMLLNNLW
jgi:hypothetical protein